MQERIKEILDDLGQGCKPLLHLEINHPIRYRKTFASYRASDKTEGGFEFIAGA